MNRISAEDAMNHDWFKMNNFESKTKNIDKEIKSMEFIKEAVENITTDNVRGALLKKEAVKILINNHLKSDQINDLKYAFQALDR